MPDTHATKAGAVDLGSGQKQHVDLFRKLRLRRALIEGLGPGSAFVPYLGEADIAVELYLERRIVGVELDAAIAAIAARRIAGLQPARGRKRQGSHVITGDAEAWHAEAAPDGPFAIGDFDAFGNPYRALETFWQNAELADRVALFGTDGTRLAIKLSKTRILGPLPGAKIAKGDMKTRRAIWNGWWAKHVRPYLAQLVAPGQIVLEAKYLRDHMLYWGVVVDRTDGASSSPPDASGSTRATPPDASAPGQPDASRLPSSTGDGTLDEINRVEKALLEAAESGNVAAAIFWLEHKGGSQWRKASPAAAMLDELTGH